MIRSIICALRSHQYVGHRFSTGGLLVSVYCCRCRRTWRVYQ